MNNTEQRSIFVAGHAGMVGAAIVRALSKDPANNVHVAPRAELDCTDQHAVNGYLHELKPQAVIVAAAKVGGIHANNQYPAEFAYENLMIEANLINAAHTSGVQNLIFLGSSCIYPKLAQQPMREDALLTGSLEPTNEPYAIAKIAGIKLCESYNRQYGRDYRSLMPTNLYGPGDNFHPDNSHVIPGLLQRFHKAAIEGQDEVIVWGTGKAHREFLHVDDLADAVVFALDLPKDVYTAHTTPQCSHVNVGTGVDVSIAELATLIARTVGFEGTIRFDTSKPDGTPRKLLDTSLINMLGWKARTGLEAGLKATYAWFREHEEELRR